MPRLRAGRCRLPELLKQNKMNQREFGKRINVSDSFVSKIISGEKTFSLNKAKEASMVLNCYIDDLYDWDVVPNYESDIE
ncbi:helix-turn-helix domain-containing protein [Chengkuizengella axinellae]|uniref:Helix-turn-helix transcriptional regulator n=1 Tax=Chengkuizengella axinellae TaxID=3064388 RepID=A0ABT9J0V2_9BACL|nr:helix-turn-helix transcriptional regulator [Chengkuizengella sp. 2205SS18-9]MDP5275245.1 helix-turn-helix transcriptional regulator [Chengkuizengella sp. 2205SS18-9]